MAASSGSDKKDKEYGLASKVADIFADDDEDLRRDRIADLANQIRADTTRSDFQKGTRLTYLRRLIRDASHDQELIDLAKDRTLTFAMNNESAKRAVVTAESQKPTIYGYSRTNIINHLNKVADIGDEAAISAAVKNGHARMRVIRMLVVAGSLRPIEFSRIKIYKDERGQWMCTDYGKSRRNEAREFISLIPQERYVKLLNIARKWVLDRSERPDHYTVYDPSTLTERLRFKRDNTTKREDGTELVYTYRDLRAFGASAIAYLKTKGDHTGSKFIRAARAALRHKPEITATEHYMRFGDDEDGNRPSTSRAQGGRSTEDDSSTDEDD